LWPSALHASALFALFTDFDLQGACLDFVGIRAAALDKRGAIAPACPTFEYVVLLGPGETRSLTCTLVAAGRRAMSTFIGFMPQQLDDCLPRIFQALDVTPDATAILAAGLQPFGGVFISVASGEPETQDSEGRDNSTCTYAHG
jgi:hypothetical protein